MHSRNYHLSTCFISLTDSGIWVQPLKFTIHFIILICADKKTQSSWLWFNSVQNIFISVIYACIQQKLFLVLYKCIKIRPACQAYESQISLARILACLALKRTEVCSKSDVWFKCVIVQDAIKKFLNFIYFTTVTMLGGETFSVWENHWNFFPG